MNKFFSKLFNEHANVTDDGSVTFDSGVVYSADEVRMLKRTGASLVDRVAIHEIKKAFGGDVEYFGQFKREIALGPLPSTPSIKETIEIEPVQLSLF